MLLRHKHSSLKKDSHPSTGISIKGSSSRIKSIFLTLLVVASTATALPLFATSTAEAATAASSKSSDFDWQIKSLLYYRSIAACMKNSPLQDSNNPITTTADRINASNAKSGKWFHGGGLNTGSLTTTTTPVGVYMRDATSGDALDVGTDGLVSCDNPSLITSALSLWGLDPIDVLCNSGFRRVDLGVSQTIATCKTGSNDFERRDGGQQNNADKFTAYIKDQVYGGKEPDLTNPQWYIYYRHTLDQSCIAGIDTKAPGSTTYGSDNQYGYNGVKWVDVPLDPSVAPSIKTGSYIGGWKTSNNVMLRADPKPDFGSHSESCSKTVSLMNNYAQAYADWATVPANRTAATDMGQGIGTPKGGDDTTTCAIDGIGWIVCPVVTFFSKMVDGIYRWIVSYVTVAPLNTDTSSDTNTTYIAWSVMRNIANVAFVVAFLIIIFSQLTSIGVSNYGIKKMLPRIIIAAILVNASYWIAAIAVDVSNIVGSSIYNLLSNISLGNVTIGDNVWETVLGTLLAGGVVGVTAAGIGAVVVAGTGAAVISAALWAAVPILLGVVLALIVAFAILAARQALIVILIIISPIAFVAFLLPNTEKFFTLWRKSLTTMLIFYPLFALLFAGSHIAALVILGSTQQANSSAPAGGMIIIALAVQVAPLWLTPFLVKFSGGIIGQLAGRLNNKNRGLIDRSKKVRDRKAGLALGETLGSSNRIKSRFGRGTVGAMRGLYRHTQNDSRLDRDRQKALEGENEAAYTESGRPQALYDRMGNAETRTKTANAQSEGARLGTDVARGLEMGLKNAEFNVDTLKVEHVADFDAQKDQELSYRTSLAKDRSAMTNLADTAHYEESKSNSQAIGANNPLAQQIQDARDTQREMDIQNNRLNSAKGVLQQELAEDLSSNPWMAARAGGIDPRGASRVAASANAAITDATNKAIASEKSTMTTTIVNPDPSNPTAENLASILRDSSTSVERRAAAAGQIMKVGTDDDIHKTLDFISSVANTPEGIIIQQQVAADMGSRKPVSLGAGDMSNLSRGSYSGMFDDKVAGRIMASKISAETLVNTTSEELDRMIATIPSLPAGSPQLVALKGQINDYLGNPNTKKPADEILSRVNAIESML